MGHEQLSPKPELTQEQKAWIATLRHIREWTFEDWAKQGMLSDLGEVIDITLPTVGYKYKRIRIDFAINRVDIEITNIRKNGTLKNGVYKVLLRYPPYTPPDIEKPKEEKETTAQQEDPLSVGKNKQMPRVVFEPSPLSYSTIVGKIMYDKQGRWTITEHETETMPKYFTKMIHQAEKLVQPTE